ncbi:hypothetical protein SAMN05518847_103261 [Paenibacillus sp. OV219]|nr:hypothetical protein SAMN05518847_103261 [Paenibacillus sp. OV219]
MEGETQDNVGMRLKSQQMAIAERVEILGVDGDKRTFAVC